MDPVTEALVAKAILFGFDLAGFGLNKLEAKAMTDELRLQGKTEEQISEALDAQSAAVSQQIRALIAQKRSGATG